MPYDRDLIREVEAQGDPACLSHLGGMPQQTKAGDVGGSVEGKVDCQLSGVPVETFHPGDGIGKFIRGSEAALEGGGYDAGAKGFGEEEAVARARAGFGQQLVVLHNTQGDETKLGLFILY